MKEAPSPTQATTEHFAVWQRYLDENAPGGNLRPELASPLVTAILKAARPCEGVDFAMAESDDGLTKLDVLVGLAAGISPGSNILWRLIAGGISAEIAALGWNGDTNALLRLVNGWFEQAEAHALDMQGGDLTQAACELASKEFPFAVGAPWFLSSAFFDSKVPVERVCVATLPGGRGLIAKPSQLKLRVGSNVRAWVETSITGTTSLGLSLWVGVQLLEPETAVRLLNLAAPRA